MFYYFKTGDNLKNPNYNIMKIVIDFYNTSLYPNLKKEYDLSANIKLTSNNSYLKLSHYNQEFDKFLNGGITQGLYYMFYGHNLFGKTFFFETLILKNLETLIIHKAKILIISTNGSLTYTKIRNSFNGKFYNKINEVINIIRFRTDNEVLKFLFVLNKKESLPFSFIFIDNFNKQIDNKNINVKTLHTHIENLKKNKNIGVVSVIFNHSNRIEIKDFKNLICSDSQINKIQFDYLFKFVNLDLNFRFFNLKKRTYFLKIYNNIGYKVFVL